MLSKYKVGEISHNIGEDGKQSFHQLNLVEKCLVLMLLLMLIYPLTLPNCYSFGYFEILPTDEPNGQCSIRDDFQLKSVQDEYFDNLMSLSNEIEQGGRYRNLRCEAASQKHVAIIVPYRNRSQHLAIMISHLHSYLIKQNQINYQIFVIEQTDQKPFNRGNLLNIGFRESLIIDPGLNCFIFHDVDILPTELNQFYTCGKLPRHICSYLDKFRFVLIYPNLFGGVITISKQQFFSVNGYSNLYSGWGGEDDDFYRRVQNKFSYIERYDSRVGRCRMIKHKSAAANNDRQDLLIEAQNRFQYDGLNSLNRTYIREGLEFNSFYVKVKVRLN